MPRAAGSTPPQTVPGYIKDWGYSGGVPSGRPAPPPPAPLQCDGVKLFHHGEAHLETEPSPAKYIQPVDIGVRASGGNGTFYSFSSAQTGVAVGTAVLDNGKTMSLNMLVNESLDSYQDRPGDSDAYFTDAPGVGLFTKDPEGRRVHKVVAFSYYISLTLDITVSNGSETVRCPTFEWTVMMTLNSNLLRSKVTPDEIGALLPR